MVDSVPIQNSGRGAIVSDDTIFALSSGALPSGVAIIRLSGQSALAAGVALAGDDLPARRAVLRSLKDADGTLLDEALVLYFSGPNSFTGEDVVELQCHGGRATVAAVLECLGKMEGLRTAEAGEFSRRAFLNGRMDLTALEGLSDLVAAQTEMQRKLALAQSGGRLRALYDGWRTDIIRSRALVEAELDFSDEEDIPDSVSAQVWSNVRRLAGEITGHLGQSRSGEIIRDGYSIVLAGAPNAGKSSLLNALARRDVAIVTDEAGTTRDLVEVSLDIGGYLVRLADTAGLRETANIVEREGIRRAREAMDTADLVLYLLSSNCPVPENPPSNSVYVRTKIDLLAEKNPEDDLIGISTVSGQGLEDLLELIRTRLTIHEFDDESAILTRERHRHALELCVSSLNDALNDRFDLPTRAYELQVAGDCLGRLTGKIDTEDLLDVIFSEFCIGK